MKKIILTILPMLVVVCFAHASVAKQGTTGGQSQVGTHGPSQNSIENTRSNAGGEVRGLDRAAEVQGMNTQANENRAQGLGNPSQTVGHKGQGMGQDDTAKNPQEGQ